MLWREATEPMISLLSHAAVIEREGEDKGKDIFKDGSCVWEAGIVHSRLSHCLQCWHPVLVKVEIPTAPFLTQLPANLLGAEKDGSKSLFWGKHIEIYSD